VLFWTLTLVAAALITVSEAVLRIRDPVLDPGWVKNQDPGSGSGMNIPDHISESLETIFWVKNT
jgi:hypothetical protein